MIRRLMRPVPALILLVLGTSFSGGAFVASVAASDAASDAAARGRALFEAADRNERGYGDLEVTLTMVLKSTSGAPTERELRIRQLERTRPAGGADGDAEAGAESRDGERGDGDKVLVVFDTPATIRGTALLSHAHPAADDDQWLFLPSIKRVKKIASRNRSGPFLGSEFTFEDLSPREIDKYTYAYVREDTYAGVECHVVDRLPKDEYSGYATERVWLDKAHLRVMQVEYFDRKNNPAKVLEVEGYRLYRERWWKPSFMLMRNLRTGKSTELHWHEYRFGIGLDADRDFSVNSLRRAR